MLLLLLSKNLFLLLFLLLFIFSISGVFIDIITSNIIITRIIFIEGIQSYRVLDPHNSSSFIIFDLFTVFLFLFTLLCFILTILITYILITIILVTFINHHIYIKIIFYIDICTTCYHL